MMWRFFKRRTTTRSNRFVRRFASSSSSSSSAPATVLVANRGEIACRVFRTAKELGMRTIAIYTEKDLSSAHILAADERHLLTDTDKGYLAMDEILDICAKRGVDAVHPGYGFLSENPEFAEKCEKAGVRFLGPRAETMRAFALKDSAREVAERAGVPVVPGTGTIESLAIAKERALELGYPVMLKAVAGGGGIGMSKVDDAEGLERVFESTVRQAQAAFGNPKVYLEKFVQSPRHIEIQVFGDGEGSCVHLGERECSIQRRHQKIIEESPSPFVTPELREKLTSAAVRLAKSVQYRSAGTVEFLVDGVTSDYYFLEMNTRLQVEHPITECVTGQDLVAWMLGRAPRPLDAFVADFPQGHAIEARLYCEDPQQSFLPSPGRLDLVDWPKDARVDTWVRTGTEVTPFYDPMIAKLIVHGESRADATRKFTEALRSTDLRGTRTNLEFVEAVSTLDAFRTGEYDTGFLESPEGVRVLDELKSGIVVSDPGIYTTVQDYPGRTTETIGGKDAWRVGIPPSGPMDHLSARVANRLVGNEDGAAVLEITSKGPTMTFHEGAYVALCGGDFGRATLNKDRKLEPWTRIRVEPGDEIEIGATGGRGMRGYLAVSGGGIDVPKYLGSRSTLPLAKLGGHQGRPLLAGDTLRLFDGAAEETAAMTTNGDDAKALASRYFANASSSSSSDWTVGVLVGPQDDYLTAEDNAMFFETAWEAHYNSNRLGVRFKGPAPQWARTDGGDGGSHPSNVVDNEYALGTINFTGDMPVAITVDGPSLGGFTCSVTAPKSEIWKFGQIAPGETVRFEPLTLRESLERQEAMDRAIASVGSTSSSFVAPATVRSDAILDGDKSLLYHHPETATAPEIRIRRQGDRFVLVEYGDQTIDFNRRFALHNLEEALHASKISGLRETSPGIVSLQIDYDNTKLPLDRLVETVADLHHSPEISVEDMVLDSRIVHLPIVIDDRWSEEALEDYAKSVRSDAPYLPNNFDFVARNNGITTDALRDIILSAEYMCLGLGDVYLGCPCACPVDPRHRIVNPKFNPARTYTPEGAVGIGGAFMCIYPMASPGGYQLVGRSLPIWNMHAIGANFEKPWLLRHFDRIKFHEVSHEELEAQFEAFRNGVHTIDIERDATFSVSEYNDFVSDPTVKRETEAFVEKQRAAAAIELDAERAYWETARASEDGDRVDEAAGAAAKDREALEANPSIEIVRAEFAANVWKINCEEGARVKQGEPIIVYEAMKMEYSVEAPCDGTVRLVDVNEGSMVDPGRFVMAIDRTVEATPVERTPSYRNVVRSHSKKGGPRFDRPSSSLESSADGTKKAKTLSRQCASSKGVGREASLG